MTVDPKVLVLWDNIELLRQFESRLELEKTLGGDLYRSIIHDEIEAIGQEAIRRTTCHPNLWREKGIVHASWTDNSGIVHNPYFHRCPSVQAVPYTVMVNPYRQDKVAKEFSCLWCLATGSGSTS